MPGDYDDGGPSSPDSPSLDRQVRPKPPPPHTHTAAVEFCHANPAFTPLHMRTSGCQSAVAIPKPSVAALLPVVTELFNKAADVCGEGLREAA